MRSRYKLNTYNNDIYIYTVYYRSLIDNKKLNNNN